MATTNVACPKCGREALVTIPRDKKLKGVRVYQKNWGPDVSGDSSARCRHCDSKIAVFYR